MDQPLSPWSTVAPPGSAWQRCWSMLARGAWMVVAAGALIVFVASLAPYTARFRTLCAPGACLPGQLTPTSAAALARLGVSAASYARLQGILVVGGSLVHFVVAGIILWRRPHDRMATFVSLWLIVAGSYATTIVRETDGSSWQIAARAIHFLNFVLLVRVFVWFPDGQPIPRWGRWLVVGVVLAEVWDFVPTFPVPGSPLRVPVELGQIVLDVVVYLGLVCAQIVRYQRYADVLRRQQTKLVVASIVTVVVAELGLLAIQFALPSSPLIALAAQNLSMLIPVLIPLAVGIAVLRYRLWDIDPLVHRALVYGTLTACVAGLYVLIVGALGTLLQAEGSLPIALLATGVVAVLFQPLRERLQRGANRLLYGERDTPYTVIARLGHRLEGALVADAVLPTIVETVAQALKLPYAAIELRRGDGTIPAAAYGTPQETALRLPLIYQRETVGELRLAPRSAGEPFTPADRALLEDLARQAGVAAHAVRLTTDLQQMAVDLQHARTQLVSAREEERRRLRRDLHDGLGSVLASINLRAGAIRATLAHNPAAADALAAEQQQAVREAIGDIRRLVHALRPPTLDELGLVGAIRERAAQCNSLPNAQGLEVTVTAPEHSPTLPAAVEVAVYRIVQEALTNVIKHAQARTCRVTLALSSEALEVMVCDDGAGLRMGRPAGVGLLAMQERAAELGGTCEIVGVREGGTCVRAWLPLSPILDDGGTHERHPHPDRR